MPSLRLTHLLLPRSPFATIVACSLALGCTFASALDISPDRIEFKSIQDSASVDLSAGGSALAPSDVQSVKLMVGQHDYDHMIQVSKDTGQIVIRPTELLEMGTYDLIIKTAQGSATVPLVALFESVDASFEAQAARQGVTAAALKERLGLTQTLGTERIRLNLPPLYYLGQTMEVQLPVAEGRTAKWVVNGNEVMPRNGEFRHVFEQTGVYDFGYIEQVDGRTVAFTTSTVRVVPEPSIPVRVNVGTTLTLHAPPGYKKFGWHLDDEAAGTEAEWTGAFDAPGTHTATVRASQPAPGTPQAFRVLTYSLTVVPKDG